jgi:GntR family transcriptional regulator, transcriptional repressor for pyruvate dehydrogenase complex
MAFEAVERRSLSDGVFEQLKSGILSGELAAGSSLPSERILAVELGVNRSAVREALKRLQQLRLVTIRQGESTRVLDFRRSGGLDLLVAMLFESDGRIALPVARGLVEMRGALGPDIAARAASRRSQTQLATLEAALEAMESIADDDLIALEVASFELWRALVTASDNLAYALAFNTMEQVWTPIREVLAPTLAPELSDRRGYRRMVERIAAGDPSAARRAADRLVTKGTEAVVALVSTWEARS